MSTVLPSVERLSARVWRVLGLNPGRFTLQGTNTYLVGTGKRRLLIDTGEADRKDYTSLLKDTLHDLQISISQIVITHWHHDHLGGLPTVLEQVCQGETPSIFKLPLNKANTEFYYPLRGAGEDYPTVSLPEQVERQIQFLKDGDLISTEGATLKVIATPGHTLDHASLWLEEENAVFTGDCILGESSAVFEELSSYMKSLEKLLALSPDKLYPGHGPVVPDGVGMIQHYIAHRQAREKEVIDFLASSTTPVSSFQIVAHIYKDVDQALWIGAENNVRLHLNKLWKEGRVICDNEGDTSVWKLNSKL